MQPPSQRYGYVSIEDKYVNLEDELSYHRCDRAGRVVEQQSNIQQRLSDLPPAGNRDGGGHYPPPGGAKDPRHLRESSTVGVGHFVESGGGGQYPQGSGGASTASPRSNVMPNPNLGIGSRIQLPTHAPSEPFKYGLIRWIGKVPYIRGSVAGIELVSGTCHVVYIYMHAWQLFIFTG